jgi:uncharacterized protein (TIGR02118 family)
VSIADSTSFKRLSDTGPDGGSMIKVSVFYPNGKNAKFDIEYYCNAHMPLVRRMVGSSLKDVSVDQCISGENPGSAP